MEATGVVPAGTHLNGVAGHPYLILFRLVLRSASACQVWAMSAAAPGQSAPVERPSSLAGTFAAPKIDISNDLTPLMRREAAPRGANGQDRWFGVWLPLAALFTPRKHREILKAGAYAF